MTEHEQKADIAASSISRRRAMRAGAAGAVGVAVWAEPTIKGLAKRPAYAATGSGPQESYSYDGNGPRNTTPIPVASTPPGVTTLVVTKSVSVYTFTVQDAMGNPVPGALLSGTVALTRNGSTVDLVFTNELSPYTVDIVQTNRHTMILNLTCS